VCELLLWITDYLIENSIMPIFNPIDLQGSMTLTDAHVDLKARIGSSSAINSLALWPGVMGVSLAHRQKRSIDAAMYMTACTAFERFIYDITGDSHGRDRFRPAIRRECTAGNVRAELALEFEAYWAIRNALTHNAGLCKDLDIWSSSNTVMQAAARYLIQEGIDNENDPDLFDLNVPLASKWWSGLINYIDEIMGIMSLPSIR
jgi:hypothetical protein